MTIVLEERDGKFHGSCPAYPAAWSCEKDVERSLGVLVIGLLRHGPVPIDLIEIRPARGERKLLAAK